MSSHSYNAESLMLAGIDVMRWLYDYGYWATSADVEAGTGLQYSLAREALTALKANGAVLTTFRAGGRHAVLYKYNMAYMEPKKAVVYDTLCALTKDMRGVTLGKLVMYMDRMQKKELYSYLCQLNIERKVARYVGDDGKYRYTPWTADLDPDKLVPFDYSRESKPVYITRYELKHAKDRLHIGDVLPVIVESKDDDYCTATELAEVVVAEKSRHLFVCLDGSTYSYADLALHYRDGRPLGRWN